MSLFLNFFTVLFSSFYYFICLLLLSKNIFFYQYLLNDNISIALQKCCPSSNSILIAISFLLKYRNNIGNMNVNIVSASFLKNCQCNRLKNSSFLHILFFNFKYHWFFYCKHIFTLWQVLLLFVQCSLSASKKVH